MISKLQNQFKKSKMQLRVHEGSPVPTVYGGTGLAKVRVRHWSEKEELWTVEMMMTNRNCHDGMVWYSKV